MQSRCERQGNARGEVLGAFEHAGLGTGREGRPPVGPHPGVLLSTRRSGGGVVDALARVALGTPYGPHMVLDGVPLSSPDAPACTREIRAHDPGPSIC